MSNDPEPGAGADDLLGRWFAHHDQSAAEKAAQERVQARRAAAEAGHAPRVPLAARPSEAASTRMTRPSASAALAELADEPAAPVERSRGVTPPSSFGVRRGVPGSAHSGPTGGSPGNTTGATGSWTDRRRWASSR